MNNDLIGGVERCPWVTHRLGAKRRRLLRIIASGLLGLAALLSYAELPAQPAGGSPPVRLLVKPKAKSPASSANVVAGSRVRRVFRNVGNLQVLELPPGMTSQMALALFKQSRDFEYAEIDQVVRLQGTAPDDFRYQTGELWGLHNTGYLNGTPGADIHAPEAWDIRHDAPNIIVALVDSGVRQTHEDLRSNLWTNPGEIPGNGIDDDGNGVIDDVHGFNAWLDNGDPEDDLGHGTHVAGTIGGAGNNGVGVVGVAWKVQIMATKFTDPQGNGTVSDAIACIDYARQMGAQVINASWGAPDLFNSAALRDAIAAARDAGIIFVTVAGNNSADNDQTLYYPGAFDLDNIIVATATDRNDQLAFFANYGANTVDLGAPGHNIFSAWKDGDSSYQYYNGGSMAVAHVSGAAALVKAQFPGDDYRRVIQRILASTDPLPSLLNKTKTGGRLNLFKALGGTLAPPVVTLTVADATAAEGGTDTATFTFTRSGSTVAPLTVLYTVGGTASNGVDYAALTGTAVISPGASSVDVTVQPIDDLHYEGTETVTLTVVAGADYTVGLTTTGTATIADNDPAPLPTVTVTASDATAAEAGSDSASFVITRTGVTTAPLTVGWTLGGTATEGSDYQAMGTSAVIAAGSSSVTVILQPIDDTLVESTETVILTLQANAAYAIGSAAQATATIADHVLPPPLPTISITVTDGTASETGGDTGTLTVVRTGPTTAALTVGLTLGGTATNGADYQSLPASIVIPAGASSATLVIRPIDDMQVEPTETVEVAIAPGAGYTVAAGGRASVTILDNDTREVLPEVSVSAPMRFTIEFGLVKGVFRVSRTGSTKTALAVKLATTGTATSAKDYIALPDTVTIPAGKSSVDIIVDPIRDRSVEPVETIELNVTSGPGYTVGGTNRATVYLFDDDWLADFLRRLREDS